MSNTISDQVREAPKLTMAVANMEALNVLSKVFLVE